MEKFYRITIFTDKANGEEIMIGPWSFISIGRENFWQIVHYSPTSPNQNFPSNIFQCTAHNVSLCHASLA